MVNANGPTEGNIEQRDRTGATSSDKLVPTGSDCNGVNRVFEAEGHDAGAAVDVIQFGGLVRGSSYNFHSIRRDCDTSSARSGLTGKHHLPCPTPWLFDQTNLSPRGSLDWFPGHHGGRGWPPLLYQLMLTSKNSGIFLFHFLP